MRRALVTGITGQTGSYLAEQLVAAEWDVFGVVRDGDGARPWPDEVADRLTLVKGDLLDVDSLRGAFAGAEPDAVFHLGGLTSVAESWTRPVDYARALAVATAQLLESARDRQERTGGSVSFVHASSAEIFGRPAVVPQNESTPIAPVSPYGAAKAHGHHLVQLYRATGLAASNVILFNHESPRRPTTFVTRKITSTVAAIARGDADHLSLGDLSARRDWGWAPEYADAIRRAGEHPDDFVIATGTAHSVREFVAAAFAAVDIADWESYVRVDPRFLRPADAPELVGDASHAAEVLGWRPTVEFDEIVARMVAADLS